MIAEARNDDPQRVLAETIPTIAKAALTRPGALFIGKFGIGPQGVEVDAGLVINTGDATEELKKVVARLEELIPGEVKSVEIDGITWKEIALDDDAPRTLWGFRGKYMVLGVGEKSIESIFERSRSAPPKWLTDLRKRLPVERPASVMYVNLPRILDLAATMGGFRGARETFDVLGLGNVQYLASVTGLEGTGLVTRQLVALDGESTGLFTLASGQPLEATELAVIPRDANFAVAARVDLEKIYQEFVTGLGRISPEARDELLREKGQAEEELGIDLSADVFKSLGDSWRIYNSPGEGGLLFTGLTAVVSVRDRAKLAKVLERIKAFSTFADRADADGGPVRLSHSTVEHIEFAKQKIYYLNFVGAESPFAPAWCLTEKELILSLFPSHVKTVLSRNASPAASGSGFQSIADLPQVKAALAGEDKPMALTYQDTRGLFRIAYPIAQIIAQLLASEAQRNGIDLKIADFPSAPVIAKHLEPAVATVTRTEAGIEVISRQSIPVGLGPLPLLGLPMRAAPLFWSFRRGHAGPIDPLDHAAPVAEPVFVPMDVPRQR